MREVFQFAKKIDTFGHKVPGSNPGEDKLFVNYLENRFYFKIIVAFKAAKAKDQN